MRQSHAGTVPLVLVVDDEEDNRVLLSELLTDAAGCAVRTVRHGAEALAVLRDDAEAAPCLVVLDWMMPVMSGAAVLAEMVRDQELVSIPVIVFTAAPDVDAPGALRVLAKPRGLSELLALAVELCDGARVSAPRDVGGSATPEGAASGVQLFERYGHRGTSGR